jgi:hypothetical protein
MEKIVARWEEIANLKFDNVNYLKAPKKFAAIP